MPLTPPTTRGRKGSLKEPVSLSDVAELIRESEERMKVFLEDKLKTIVREELCAINDRLSDFGSTLSTLQGECVRLDDQISTIKNIIFRQHLHLEEQEKKLREKNIIVHNIPEGKLTDGSDLLRDDKEKIALLCNSATVRFDDDAIVDVQRVGKPDVNKTRPLKVTLKSTDTKYKFLNNRREITMNDDIKRFFKRKVHVNPDSSPFVQKEEKGLREKPKN